MMKRLTVIIAFMLCVGSVMAQYEKGECYFRPYMGLMFSNMESKAFSSSCDLKWKVNMTLGGQFEWQLLKSSSLLMDANYRRQGCMIDYKGYYGNTDGDDKMTVDFLNFGLQWKMYLKPNLSARVGIELMSKVGNLTTHYRVYGEDVSVDEEDKEGGSEIIDQAMWSVPIGLSFEYKNFTFSATYHLDGNRICDAISPDDGVHSAWESWSEPVYFYTFDFTCGYTIPLRKKK